MNFWEKVDSELKYLGKSRKELAAAVGIDPANISFGIKRNSIPYADTALKVARFLGVPLEILLNMPSDTEVDSTNPQITEIQNRLRKFNQNDLNAVLAVTKSIEEKY